MITWLRIGVIVVALSIVTLVLLPFQMAGLAFDLRMRRYIPRYWHRAACWLLGIRIHLHGRIDRRRPLMLAANHASWKDILVLGAVADVAFIAKSEVADWPVFGLLAKLQKTIFVARDQKRQAGQQVNEIAERMKAGEIVVLFPEGTTSDGNRLLDIKSSLFGAAAAAVPSVPGNVVHVQPVAIAYTRVYGMAMGRYHRPIAAWPGDIELVPHLMGVLKAEAIDVDVSFGEAVAFRAGDNRKALSAEVAAKIRRMLLARLRGRDYG
ncbi:1-acyl-sn-glycerol-3-phosphate acyltransferase [Pseudorhizobium endolithicum]|uniref:1-acyl-sn-glycerol-3-phosphate acyltransferase n=1 Tax=Pseudorhizobium endolithicum TaxID=1191678 RepID=A0ABN7JXC4_9HYPH|nr:lysophospholipid acyltransferase family protein [Pseudorhizobium endolithicum]CAD6426759.1 1-acyl-sn-glycerol-3-phosphate acyltransferase [Rhizobium sp. Q54]CAD7052098.1 1-acyl-sn-glycerol-3-phosphate acyltransferase [Pseudorhizobium endolithicum]